MTKVCTQDVLDAIERHALFVGGLAKHAADIAHARKALFDAYLNEGFSEAQALDLCKVTIS